MENDIYELKKELNYIKTEIDKIDRNIKGMNTTLDSIYQEIMGNCYTGRLGILEKIKDIIKDER